MNVTVLLFATLKDKAGSDRLTLTLPGDQTTLGDLRSALGTHHPALVAYLPTAVGAINKEFAFPADPIKDGDEVAFFPPVSGGQGAEPPVSGGQGAEPPVSGGEEDPSLWPEIYRLDADPIDLNVLTQAITLPATGAVCLFSGAVRGETSADGQIVHTARLEYEAYAPMALAKMRQVAVEIRQRWPLVQGIAIVQRIGRLAVGEPTVLIACAAGHRDQGCFEAARYGIDRLKEIVPVWKKEISAEVDQADQWVTGHHLPTPDDRSTS